jgi:hypothetical protein
MGNYGYILHVVVIKGRLVLKMLFSITNCCEQRTYLQDTTKRQATIEILGSSPRNDRLRAYRDRWIDVLEISNTSAKKENKQLCLQ